MTAITLLFLRDYGIFSFCHMLEYAILTKGFSVWTCISIAIVALLFQESLRRLPGGLGPFYILLVERITSFMFHFLMIYIFYYILIVVYANN